LSISMPDKENKFASPRSLRNTRLEKSRDWLNAFWASQRPDHTEEWTSLSHSAGRSERQSKNAIGFGPPWEQTRTVIEGDPHRVFKALKTRLVPLSIRSRHTRQRLYRDRQTGQHWLSLITSIRRCDERRELLKPISPDVAASLFHPLV